MLKTKHWVGHMEFEVHALEMDFEIPEDPFNIILKEKREGFDTLTRVVINGGANIYVYWSSNWNGGTYFETLVNPEDYIMFIGAGSISAQINLNNSSLIRVRDVTLFEYFMRFDECIVECCDSECTAFSNNGDILNYHELEMMWKIHFEGKNLYTESDHHGRRWLVKT